MQILSTNIGARLTATPSKSNIFGFGMSNAKSTVIN